MSLIEAITNVAVGFGVAIARSYLLRRLFEAIRVARAEPAKPLLRRRGRVSPAR